MLKSSAIDRETSMRDSLSFRGYGSELEHLTFVL